MALNSITHVHYAFFDVTATCEVATLDAYADWDIVYPELGMSWNDPPGTVRGNIGAFQILREQHPHVKIAFSLGGWTKSNYFSGCAKDPTKRAVLVASAMDMLSRTDFDGIDVDWEYPVCCGEGDNQVDANDWANYVLLLRALREAMDEQWPSRHMELTIAMGMSPSVTGVAPMEDLADVLDAVNLMTYDYNGAWGTRIAHNAPLYNDPAYVAAGGDAAFNIDWGVQLWLSRVPAHKLVLGMPAYGRGWSSSAMQPAEYSTASGAGAGTWEAGVYSYWDIAANYLTNAAYTHGWNDVSKVPYVRGDGTFISYDNEQSIALKASYAKDLGLAGLMWWEASDDKDGVLLAAANAAFGHTPARRQLSTVEARAPRPATSPSSLFASVSAAALCIVALVAILAKVITLRNTTPRHSNGRLARACTSDFDV